MTTTTSCVVVEILRFKISREVWKFSKSRKIVAFIEGHYKYKKVQSEDATVYEGSKFDIPYNEKLREIAIHFFFIDGLLTIDVGSCIYDLAHDKLFVDDGNVTSVTLNIFPNGSTIPIGKVSFNTFVQDMYGDDINGSRSSDNNRSTHKKKEHDHDVSDHQLIVPGFKFKRLSRVLHWDRLRSINLDRVVESNDSATLLTMLDDVTNGDISQEESDPKLYAAIQLAQYASQYLLSCRKVMKDREQVLRSALDTFQEEDDVLELKLTKLRARERALIRESRDLDKISSEYSSALKVLNPRLVDRLYKTYKEKLNIAKNPGRYHHRHEDVFDYYNDYDYDKDVYPRHNEEEKKDHHESKQHNHNRMTTNSSDYRRTNQQQGRAWVSQSGVPPGIKQQQQQRSTSSDSWAHSGSTSRGVPSFNDPTDVMNNNAAAVALAAAAAAVTKHNSSYGNNKDQKLDEVQRQRRDYDDDSSDDDAVKTRDTYPAALESNIIDEDNNHHKVNPVVKLQRHTSVRTIAVHKDRPDDQGKSDMNQPELTSSTSIDFPLSNKHALSNRSTMAGLNMHSLQASTVKSSTAISTDSLVAATAPPTIDIDTKGQQSKGFHVSSTTTASETTHNQAQPFSISLKQQQQQQQQQSSIGRTDPSRSNMDNHLESSTEDFPVRKKASSDLYDSAHRTDDVPHRDYSYDESMMMASPNHLSRSMLISGLEGNMQGVHQPLSHQSATSLSDHMKSDDGIHHSVIIKKEDIVVRKSDMVFLEDYDDEDDEYDPYQLDSTRSKSKNFNNFSNIDHDSTEIDTSTSFRIELPSENVGDKSGGKQSIHSPSLYIDLNTDSNARWDNRHADIRDKAPKINKFKQTNSSSSSSKSQFTSNMLSPYREHSNYNNNYSLDDAEEKGLEDWSNNNNNDNDNNDNSDSLLFSPMSDNNVKAGSRNNTFRLKNNNSTFGDYDDDEVLFGTTRLSGGRQDYNNNSSSQMMMTMEEEELGNTFQFISHPTSDMGTSGPFERDSLGLTIATNPSSSSTDSNLQSVRPNHRGRSSFSPVAELSMEHTRTTCTEDDESIPPPTYDSVISMKGSRSKQQTSNDRLGAGEESNLFIDLSDTAESMTAVAADALVWCSGKASLEAIELATAIEVFVSTIKLEPVIVELIPEIKISIEFLGLSSPPSSIINLGSGRGTDALQPVSYCSYLKFNDESEMLLIDEIAEYDDALALQLHVLDASSNDRLGSANVELWVMIEDSVNILRQEVEVMNNDLSDSIGYVYIDLKGFRLLKKCANRVRSQRKNRNN